MKKGLIYSSVVLFLFFLAGCDSNELALNTLRVEIVGQSSTSNSSSVRNISGGRITAEGDTVVFNKFLLGLTELSLNKEGKSLWKHHGDDDEENEGHSYYKGHCEDDDSEFEEADSTNHWKVEGEFIVDLIAGTSTPDITGSLPAESGTYRKMEIELSPILSDSNSLEINADVTQNDSTYHVEFISDRTFKIHLWRRDGIQIDQSIESITLALSVDKLFAGIDWSKATADDDGVIRLQNPANFFIALKVKVNLYSMMRWGHDKNHDHCLDHHDD
jgi:hypothetical protein